jgi:outer membrane receptor protein involved in Fe transport
MSKGANLDLERVEVLKGPQGILYGRNTTGGLINYIARKPTDTFQSGMTASVGRFETTDVEAFVSGPLSEHVLGRLAVRDIRSQKGWQKSVTRDDTIGKIDKQALRGALEYRPQDDLSFRFVIDGWIDKSDSQMPQPVGMKIQQPIVPNTPAALQAISAGAANALAAGLLDPSQIAGLNSILAGNATLAPQVASYPLLNVHEDNPRLADWAPGFDWSLNDHFHSASLRSNYALSEAYTLTGIASYMKVASDGSELNQSGVDTLNSDRSLNASIETEALEFRIARNAEDRFNWMFGVNGSYDDGYEQNTLYVETVSVLFPNPVNGHTISDKVAIFGDQDATQLAAFVNGDWEFVDDYKLSGGLRFTQEKRKHTACSYVVPEAEGYFGSPGALPVAFTALASRDDPQLVVPNGHHQEVGEFAGDCFPLTGDGAVIPTDADPGLFHGRITDRNVSGRIALDWNPAAGTLLYASIARGFKSGGFPVTNTTQHFQYSPTKQEELIAYELGSKLTVLEGALRFNTAVFYYDYKDKQLLTRFLDPVFGPLPILRNAPKSEVTGVELDFQSKPFRGMYFAGAGAYIKTKILEFTSTNINGEQEDFAGRPFNFTPKLTYTLLADYTLPVTAGDVEFAAAADYTFTDKTNSTLEEDPRFAHLSSKVVGARLRAQSMRGDWTVTLFGRNLTNEVVTVSNFNVGDVITRFVGPPRTYGLTLNIDFGGSGAPSGTGGPSWVPWVVGGALGLAAGAIVGRELGIDPKPDFDTRGPPDHGHNLPR